MVNVSKKQLPEGRLEKVFSQVNKILGVLDAPQVDILLSELLGHEERIMIAKRLSALLMLSQGHSLYKTAEKLQISTSTAEKIYTQMKKGSFDGILALFYKKKKDNEFVQLLDAVDSILHLGGILPHYNGPDRYRRRK